MPMWLRKIKHEAYLKLVLMVLGGAKAAPHMAFVGAGSSRQLCAHIARSGAKRVLVVTDKPLRDLGVVDQAIQGLIDAGVAVSYYDGVQPNPTYAQVAEGAQVLRASNCEIVLAVGGGSAIDAAKIIAASASSDEDPVNWAGFGKVKHQILKIYAIPTTAGTGSEATIGAVISDPKSHQKNVISGVNLLPAAIALDSELCLGLPPHITAATGMDALTHGIEAYISVWRERGSAKEHAELAIKLVFKYLLSAYKDGSNSEAREGLSVAAYYAGVAINQVNVGNVHAIAHQLGGHYGIPHGLANAMVLPHVLRFCQAGSRTQLAELALLVGVGKAGESEMALAGHFIDAIEALMRDLAIATRSDLIKAADFDALAAAAMAEGDGYPVPKMLDSESTMGILRAISPI